MFLSHVPPFSIDASGMGPCPTADVNGFPKKKCSSRGPLYYTDTPGLRGASSEPETLQQIATTTMTASCSLEAVFSDAMQLRHHNSNG